MGFEDFIGAGFNFASGFMNRDAAERMNQENIANQRDFAQHGISWKVADAIQAGINPLAALGAQTSSFSNVTGDTSPGTGIAAGGQDIARAIHSMSSPEDRQSAVVKSKLDLERMGLENDILRTRLASSLRSVSQPGTGPGIPAAFTRYRGRSGEDIWLPSKDASTGYQALGGIAGAGEALLGQRGGAGGDKGGNHTGVSPWHFEDFKRWLFPSGSALFGP